jgi:hypothetical protein
MGHFLLQSTSNKKGVFPMAKHRVGGKKAHVKKVGKKRRGGKRHSKKSAIKA